MTISTEDPRAPGRCILCDARCGTNKICNDCADPPEGRCGHCHGTGGVQASFGEAGVIDGDCHVCGGTGRV